MVQVVSEKGYAAATVADAVRVAKVSRGTFYELFESKQPCLCEAYRLGIEVLEQRIAEAVKGARRLATRRSAWACARTCTCCSEEPRFAHVHLLEWDVLGAEREEALAHFARRYGKSFKKAGRPVPPRRRAVRAVGRHRPARHARACATAKT